MVDRRTYVNEQVSTILGAPVCLNDDRVARFWALLTREEEHAAPRDRHGNFTHAASALSLLGLLEHPPLHEDLAELAAGIATTPRWPNGKRFAACLTHDVDRIVNFPWRERLRHVRLLGRQLPPLVTLRRLGAAAGYACRALRGMDRAPFDFWHAEEGRRGMHSTFFVLPECLAQPTDHDHLYRYGDSVVFLGTRMPFGEAARLINAQGWEIGLHGSYASAFDGELLRAEKAQVDAMLGASVCSVRQHFLRFRADTTPALQAAAGLTADATLGYNQTIGCRAGLAFPFFWPGEGDLLEVPLIIQDVGLLRHDPLRNPRAAAERAQQLIERVARAGGVITLGWHTHPDSPGALEGYRALLDTIEALNGWGCSVSELAHWWRQRRAQVRGGIVIVSNRSTTQPTADDDACGAEQYAAGSERA